MASKSRSKGSSKSGTRGRSASGGRAQPKRGASAGAGSGASTSRAAASEAPARTPGLDVKAVDRLVARANDAMPKGRARSAFSGTTPVSPNAVTVIGAVPAVVIVGISVAIHAPVLLLGAAGAMVLVMFVLMRVVNSTCVVAELPDELAVFTNRPDGLELRARGELEVRVLPYRDPRWLHVEVGDDKLWVSRRAFGVVIDRLAGAGDEPPG